MTRRGLFLVLAITGCASSGPGPREPLAPIKPLSGRWVTVAEGQTLEQIAAANTMSIEDIEELNTIDRSDSLAPGTELFLPDIPAGTAKLRNEGLPTSKTTVDAHSQTSPSLAGGMFSWPLTAGQITSRFGKDGRRIHEGIDIVAPRGTPVMAAADGTVVYEGNGLSGYGNLILLKHDQGLVTVYAHNDRNLVQRGTRVRRGQVIAEVGRTGRATTDHLHFEVREGELPRDPLKYVSPPQRN